jgi:hypothetical protein
MENLSWINSSTRYGHNSYRTNLKTDYVLASLERRLRKISTIFVCHFSSNHWPFKLFLLSHRSYLQESVKKEFKRVHLHCRAPFEPAPYSDHRSNPQFGTNYCLARRSSALLEEKRKYSRLLCDPSEPKLKSLISQFEVDLSFTCNLILLTSWGRLQIPGWRTSISAQRIVPSESHCRKASGPSSFGLSTFVMSQSQAIISCSSSIEY